MQTLIIFRYHWHNTNELQRWHTHSAGIISGSKFSGWLIFYLTNLKKNKFKVILLITIFNTVTVVMMALRKKKAEYENSNTITTCNIKFITSHDNVNI